MVQRPTESTHAGAPAGRDRILGAVAVGACIAACASSAAAQCALCGQAVPYAGSDPKRTALAFLTAALVLLVPTFTAAAAVGRMLWRHRDPE
jgi:hypothetical protein